MESTVLRSSADSVGSFEFRFLTDASQPHTVRDKGLSLDRGDMDVGIKLVGQTIYQRFKPVENGHHQNQGGRTDTHAQNGQASQQMDDIGRFSGNQIPAGKKEWKPHDGM